MIAHRILSRVLCLASLAAVPSALGDPSDRPVVREHADGSVLVDGQRFESWGAYFTSDVFRANGRRCGASAGTEAPLDGGGGEDCTLSLTNPSDDYDPSVVRYRIPVVVHVIRQDNGVTGHLSVEMVRSQIEILNEDFLALPGTNGEDGTDVQIEFFLATFDPNNDPTDGITYSNNTQWFNDDGNYWDALAWDTSRYLNIYTNTASGYLGYVPALPQSGIPGSNRDRVVCHYRAFGRNAPWVPYHLGRTAVHEIGHYVGLFHTFSGGCGSGSCYEAGDLICDTNPESNPHFGCPVTFSCSSEDPIHNYMNYTDDPCMGEFTPEQARRARCSLEHYRPDLYEIESTCAADLDASGDVGFPDLLQLLAVWGPCDDCPEDLDMSGDVGFPDLLALLSAWGPC